MTWDDPGRTRVVEGPGRRYGLKNIRIVYVATVFVLRLK